MTAQPQWSPVDDTTADLLTVLSDPHPIVGADATAAFLAACEADAAAHGGLVSVNRVRERLADAGIEPHRYSAMWSHFTGRGKPMEKARLADGSVMWQTCKGSKSGNNGRPYPLRRWVGDGR